MSAPSASLVLVINSGSSSLKFSVYDRQSQQEILSGLAERLGSPDATLTWRPMVNEPDTSAPKQSLDIANADHKVALKAVMTALDSAGYQAENLLAAGHRVVHGGEFFNQSVRVDDGVMATIADLDHLAPLHNPANLQGIKALSALHPSLPQVAVFDTAFHQTLPAYAYTYGLPHRLYTEHGVRRYGFHGTSHRFVSAEAVKRLQLLNTSQPTPVTAGNHRIITAHLGNGCSACAVKNGQSMDTTMGMTPLEGLLMGTRSGDVDPSIHQFLHDRTGMSLSEITDMLNRESGLLGISGLSNDMRTLMTAAEEGNEQAQLAIDVFCYRLAKAIAGLTIATQGLDALVFTGGIGENAAGIRANVVHHLASLGLNLDITANFTHGKDQLGLISTTHEPAVLVIPTEEERMIALDTLALVAPDATD